MNIFDLIIKQIEQRIIEIKSNRSRSPIALMEKANIPGLKEAIYIIKEIEKQCE